MRFSGTAVPPTAAESLTISDFRDCSCSGAPFSSAWIGSPARSARDEPDGGAFGAALEDPAGAAKDATDLGLNATFDAIISAGQAGQHAARSGKEFVDDMNSLATGGLGDALSQMKALVPEGAS